MRKCEKKIDARRIYGCRRRLFDKYKERTGALILGGALLLLPPDVGARTAVPSTLFISPPPFILMVRREMQVPPETAQRQLPPAIMHATPSKRGSKQQAERPLLLERANSIELAMIAHHLPFEISQLGRSFMGIVRDYLPVRSVSQLQAFLNNEGFRDFQAERLRGGSFDVFTIYSLFSLLQYQQATAPAAESARATECLVRLRTLIYPMIYDGNPDDQAEVERATEEFLHVAGFRGTSPRAQITDAQQLLGRHGHEDFENQPVPSIGQFGKRTLFALLAYSAGLDAASTRELVSRTLARAPQLPRLGRPELVPGRGFPQIPYPIPNYHFTPARGRWGYNRGSFGTISRRGYIHPAIDLFAPIGARLESPVDGTVVHLTRADTSRIGGNSVTIRARDGTYYYFAHMDRIMVQEGRPVRAGMQIGTVGNTGSAENTTPHCHFEVYIIRGGRRFHLDPDDIFVRP